MFALGRIVKATGGITNSPHTQFVVIGVVLGLMTVSRTKQKQWKMVAKQLTVFGAGIAFLWTLDASGRGDLFGGKGTPPGHHASVVFLLTTAMALIVTAWVNLAEDLSPDVAGTSNRS